MAWYINMQLIKLTTVTLELFFYFYLFLALFRIVVPFAANSDKEILYRRL